MKFALQELEQFGVTFQPQDRTLLARISTKTSLSSCLQLGARSVNVGFYPSVLPSFREEIAVFDSITVMYGGKEYHPVCRFHIWDEGTIFRSDTNFGLITRDGLESLATIGSC